MASVRWQDTKIGKFDSWIHAYACAANETIRLIEFVTPLIVHLPLI